MANTVTNISLANTFGEWVVATDALIRENNILAESDYTKDSGTLYLAESTQNALQANGDVIMQKELRVVGTGSSATIQNNLTVGGQVYFSNASLGLTHTGQANLNGLVLVQGPGIALNVANNVYIGGNTTIQNNVIASKVQSNSSINTTNLSVVSNTYTNILYANTNIVTETLSATEEIYTDKLYANASVDTSVINVLGTVFGNVLRSNTDIVGSHISANTLVIAANVISNGSISAANTVFANTHQANVSVVTGILSANTLVIANNIVSNDWISAANTIVSNDFLANNSVTAEEVIVNQAISTLNTYTNRLQANTSGTFNALSSNTVIIGNNIVSNVSISANNTIVSDKLKANTQINAPLAYIDVIRANTSVNTSNVITVDEYASNTIYAKTISGTTNVVTPTVVVSNKIDANSATGYFDRIQTLGELSVGGNFVINGQTIYNSNVFTLNAGSSGGQISKFDVNRGVTGANASIRWNETQLYFDILNVDNLNYYKILTEQNFNDTITSTSTSSIATANSVNAVNRYAISGYATSNASFIKANSAFDHANASYNAANNVFPQIQPSFNQANSSYDRANTSANEFVGTTGTIYPNSGRISLTSNNGLTVVATSSNTFSISTPQDLRTTASPTFTNITGTNLSLNVPLPISSGGTGKNSAADALTALLPEGSTAGYVLTTGGPGNFYWSAGGGGSGGTAPGTSILSTRSSHTGNGSQTIFTTPTFNNSTQVRVYINGVRQYESEYTLDQTNKTVTFGSAPAVADPILIEVDGYILTPYYANNIPYTINSTISPSANTIQLVVDSLATKLVTHYANTNSTTTQPFLSVVTGTTVAPGTSNTAFATTAYVQSLANSSGTLTTNITGNSGTVTNGVYTNGTYANPTWITSLANTKITGTFDTNKITGLANSATTDTTSASNITSGTLSATRLSTSGVVADTYGTASSVPTYTVDSYGRITSATNVNISIGTGSITGLAPSATTDTTNASNITGGTLNADRLSNNIPVAKITGLATSATTDTTSASNITSGTLGAARLPYTMDQSVGTTNNVQFTSLGIGTAASGVSGEIRATNEITAYYSDERLKTKLGNIENALDKVMSLNGFYYEANEIAQSLGYEVKKEVGVSAQEVQRVLPEVIAPAPADENYLTVHYHKIVPLLIEAIKELKNEIESIKGNNK